MLPSLAGAILAGLLAFFFANILRPFFLKMGLVDEPERLVRKIHTRAIVLVGGAAIMLAVIFVLGITKQIAPELLPQLSLHKWVALGFAIFILFGFGFLDDRYGLPPIVQMCGPIIAALLVVQSGIQVLKITNPFVNGTINFTTVVWIAPCITFIWLMAMMYSTKLLDGLDGLATGLSAIGACLIFGLTHLPKFYEPRIGFLALVFAGACIGFLVLNFYPARAFLGEGGSLFVGFMLGILAILSGSKIATTLLVMGLPLFDVARVIIVRLLRRQPIFVGDQLHLHHLLLRNGFLHRTAVLTYYILGIGFGVTALLFQSRGKLIMLGLLALVSLVLTITLHTRIKKV